MVANSATKKQPDSSKPVPGKQDVIEMLVSWCELAAEAGLMVEQFYNKEQSRFSIRVSGVNLEDGMLIVANLADKEDELGKSDDDK